MGKLHVKGWGRKTNYLNGKVACQGLRVSQKQHGKNGPQRQPFYTTNKQSTEVSVISAIKNDSMHPFNKQTTAKIPEKLVKSQKVECSL